METVLCPSCKKEVKWDVNNPYCPFCCERCKLLDLGAWASDAYRIPDKPVDLDEIERTAHDTDLEDPRDDE